MKLEGTIVAAHGRHYLVELDNGETLPCFPRGKKSELACGDRVTVQRSSDSQGVIEAIAPRQSLLYRSNEFKHKLIAANVSQIIIVVATEPSFSDALVTRCLVAAEGQDLKTLIVLNKCDLSERVDSALSVLAPFTKLGYPILQISAREKTASAEALRPFLVGHTSVLVGQSGMGKSTLINALIEGANARTREISEALDSGKHTTTHATLYRLDAESILIDSPGLQEFGLRHVPPGDLEQAFPEFRPYIGQCRFRNCRHDQEPGCAIRAAIEAGHIDPRRHTSFLTLYAEATR
ncbi:ribosome small subunit-dependent GTPase A [Propionivibrio limicola]|uniref:ribosome small subunit-dependent GTPase A n=1 Tax=Propionivibrio limicola TaxID=167645 RepID=UPI0012929B92|nr:ribosome small subunit-dependent GTPase A [Propionivibrio limicola]